MPLRLSKLLLVLALASSIGLHWAFLQSVAWATMLAGNLRTSALPQAVERTFDGKHPCCLCKVIAKGKQAEKKNEFPSPLKRVDFWNQTAGFILNPPARYQLPPAQNARAESLVSPPPTPPPRLS